MFNLTSSSSAASWTPTLRHLVCFNGFHSPPLFRVSFCLLKRNFFFFLQDSLFARNDHVTLKAREKWWIFTSASDVSPRDWSVCCKEAGLNARCVWLAHPAGEARAAGVAGPPRAGGGAARDVKQTHLLERWRRGGAMTSWVFPGKFVPRSNPFHCLLNVHFTQRKRPKVFPFSCFSFCFKK